MNTRPQWNIQSHSPHLARISLHPSQALTVCCKLYHTSHRAYRISQLPFITISQWQLWARHHTLRHMYNTPRPHLWLPPYPYQPYIAVRATSQTTTTRNNFITLLTKFSCIKYPSPLNKPVWSDAPMTTTSFPSRNLRSVPPQFLPDDPPGVFIQRPKIRSYQ